MTDDEVAVDAKRVRELEAELADCELVGNEWMRRAKEAEALVAGLTKKIGVANAVIVGLRRLIDEASRTSAYRVDL